jgi:hypothetical protein
MDTSEADTQPDAPESPFAGLDYDLEQRPPSTAAIGPLTRDLVAIFGCSPRHALAAATLIDRGWVEDAMALLDAGRQARAAQEEAAKAKRRAK